MKSRDDDHTFSVTVKEENNYVMCFVFPPIEEVLPSIEGGQCANMKYHHCN